MRLPDGVGLRPASATDLPLLQRVYGGTRPDAMLVLDWLEPHEDAFVQLRRSHAAASVKAGQ